MKSSTFNKYGLYVEYTRHRDGPEHQFVVCHRGQSSICTTKEQVLRRLKLGLGTTTKEEMTSWLDTINLEPKTEPSTK